MKTDLRGKVAFVTGGGSGIGQAISRVLAANGASVVVADIDGVRGRAAAEELPDAVGATMDVRDAGQIEAAVADTLQRFGSLDILVNNAGVAPQANRVDIDTLPIEEWHRVISIDLDGLFLVSRAVAPTMIARGSGRINGHILVADGGWTAGYMM